MVKNDKGNNMELSKLEIQLMLREMNIKISADQSYDELKGLLQKENHNRWLKSVSANLDGKNPKAKQVIKRRRKADKKPVVQIDQVVKDTIKDRNYEAQYADELSTEHEYNPSSPHSTRPLVFVKDKNTGDNPNKIFSRTKNVFASVKKRANNCCELCAKKDDDISLVLEPHYIVPPSDGGDHSIKNVVLLCRECLETVTNKQNPADIKKLKRKARSKIYASIEVVKKARLNPRKNG